MTIEALDTNRNTVPKLLQLKELGYKTILRYLAAGDPPKPVTETEARSMKSLGLRLGLIYEAYGDTRNELYAGLGSAHARDALIKAPKVGTPDGAAIYFAVDRDESVSDIHSRIIPYFQAIKMAINGRYRIGVYGSGLVSETILDAGLAELTFISCSTGWAGYQAFKASGRWNLLQHLPRIVAGLDADPDEINPLRPDIGDFVPFSALSTPASAPAPAPAPVTLARLQIAVGQPSGSIDTIDKLVDMNTALRTFQRTHGLAVDAIPGALTLARVP